MKKVLEVRMEDKNRVRAFNYEKFVDANISQDEMNKIAYDVAKNDFNDAVVMGYSLRDYDETMTILLTSSELEIVMDVLKHEQSSKLQAIIDKINCQIKY